MSRWIYLLVSVMLGVQMVYAQSTGGTISGSVKDASGAVIPGAAVTVRNVETGIERIVTADAQGRYRAPNLALGNYEVDAQFTGFRTEVRTGIKLTVGREAVVELVLNPGEVAERITVSGEAPLVEVNSSSMGGLVDDRTIRELPLNGRSYDQLALLETGVVSYGGGTGRNFFYSAGESKFSVAGSRGNSNSFLLDGTDVNDQANSTPGGAAGTNLGVEAIREFKILTNNFTAEYGRSSGGIISAVTKSGTNDLTGTVFGFHRNSAMDARNFFDVGDVPAFKRHQFGGVLGGAIKKEKVFYFGSYEGLRESLGTTKIAFVPTGDAKNGRLSSGPVTVSNSIRPFLALYPDPNGRIYDGNEVGEFISAPQVVTREDYASGRVDYQLSTNHSVFGRYIFDDSRVQDPGEIPRFGVLLEARRQYSTVQVSSILTPTLLNSFRFAFNRTLQTNDDLGSEEDFGPALSFIPGLTIGRIEIGERFTAAGGRGITGIGTGNTTPRFTAYNLFEWDDDLSYVRGPHSWKTGFAYRRIGDNTAQNTSLRGQYTFPTLARLLTGSPSNLEASLPGQEAYKAFRQDIIGFYGQNDFQVNSRLTLNLGLRWEFTTNPTDANGQMSILRNPLDRDITLTEEFFKVSKKNLEPRVGFAMRVTESGSTVVRGSFGIFHDHILPFFYALNVSKLPPYFTAASLTNPPFPDGYRLLQAGLPRLIQIAPENQSPTKNHYSLSIQQQFLGDNVLEIGYVGSQSSHLGRFQEMNSPVPDIINGEKFYRAGPLLRRNQFYDSNRVMTFDSTSNYNGLLLKVRGTNRAGMQYQVSYTLSRVIDQISGVASADTARDLATSLDADNRTRDSGRASFDATNNLVTNITYPLPFRFENTTTELILAGWSVSSILTATSGQPFTARLGFSGARDGNTLTPDRPDLVPGARNNPTSGVSAGCTNPSGAVAFPAGTPVGTPDRWYDPCSFSIPSPGTYGNLARNSVRGPGLVNLDLSVVKDFEVTEQWTVRFRGEFFNLLNHANFGLPTTSNFANTGARNATAGRIIDTVNSSRQVQLGLKIMF